VPSNARSASLRSRATRPYAELIREAAERHRVDARLVEAVVTAESAGNPRAVSRKGAQGLMQLMPRRSALLGVRDPFDPRQNIEGGVRHLRDLLERYRGDLTLALAAYNAGEEAVRTYSGIPPYAETQEYVRRVRTLYNGVEGPGPAWAVGQTPQRVYRQVAEDGTISFTNLPPRPASTLRRGF
jgi:soluble lytic murein transglycosylase-like protein